jgi:hypothetical protein
VKRFLRATVLTLGAALTISFAAVTQPSPDALAQVVPSPSPSAAAPVVPAAAPAVSPAASPAVTTPAPRAGGFPVELAWPMVAGGVAALGAGAYVLRRGKR